jgi:hypothetical protein
MAYPNPFGEDYYPQTPQEIELPAPVPARPIIRAPASGKASKLGQAVEAKQARAVPGRQLLQQLFEQQQEAVNKQHQAADEAEALPTGLNLAPLLALTDSWTGSKMAPSYQQPESPEEKQLRVAKLRQLAGEGQEKVTKQQLSLLLGEGKDDTNLLRALASGMGGAAGDIKALQLQLAKDKYLSEDLKKIETPFEDQLQDLEFVQEGLESANVQALGTIISKYSRVVAGEKGVLTDEDVNRTSLKNFFKDIASVQSYFSKNPASKIPPEYVQGMIELTERAKEKLVKKTENYLSGHRHKFSVLDSYRDMMLPGQGGDRAFKGYEERVGKYKKSKELVKPAEIDQADWDKATPDERKDAVKAFPPKKK